VKIGQHIRVPTARSGPRAPDDERAEATRGIIQSKANYAAAISAKIAAGESTADGLASAIGNEWYALGAIITLPIANIIVGVWRPRLAKP
jgi:hypothetical protein